MEGLAAAEIPGVLFEEDFDAPARLPEEAPAPEPEVIEAVLTLADIEDAREAGRQAGLAEARGELAAVQAALRDASLAAIGDALAASRGDTEAVAQRMADEVAGAVLALLAAALPAASEALAGSEVTALLAALLPGLRREPALALTLHPNVLKLVRDELTRAFPDQVSRMILNEDVAMAPADLRLVWEDGEARRDMAALWAGLRAALAPYRLPDLAALFESTNHGE